MTAILSWFWNDGSGGGGGRFSVDQLKGKKLSPMFRPDAVVVFRAKVEYLVILRASFIFIPEDD